MDDSQPTPDRVQEDWWIAGLKLSSDDLERLLTGMELTDTLINAAQSILQRQFPGCSGFQDVTLVLCSRFVQFLALQCKLYTQVCFCVILSNKVYNLFKLCYSNWATVATMYIYMYNYRLTQYNHIKFLVPPK